MKDLSKNQRALLLEFIANARFPKRPFARELEELFESLMSSVNVRQLKQLPQSFDVILIQSAFSLMKEWFLVENSLRTPSESFAAISEIQVQIEELVETCESGGFRPTDWGNSLELPLSIA